MNIKLNPAWEMTPAERAKAMEAGKPYDRIPCIPFFGEFKCKISGASVWDIWHDAHKMADTELAVFNRYGLDRLMIGPNSLGIAEALGAEIAYPDQGPYVKGSAIINYQQLDNMEPIQAGIHRRIAVFLEAADIMQEKALPYVPVEASVGGPFTIASFLRGPERLLRDLRKMPEQVHRLLRLITDSEKSCIKEMTARGLGIAFADPVANPALIGPRAYGEFAFPYIRELTDYVYEQGKKKGSLHMCGETYRIWKYFRQLTVNEISLDNVIDLERAVNELSDAVPIAGNVPPVDVVMDGTRDEIFAAVRKCIKLGRHAKMGYRLSTGCEVPMHTPPEKVDWFMEAANKYGKNT